MRRIHRLALAGVLGAVTPGIGGCAGIIVGAATDVAIEVVKIPFKVAGAAIDVLVPDEDQRDEDRLDDGDS